MRPLDSKSDAKRRLLGCCGGELLAASFEAEEHRAIGNHAAERLDLRLARAQRELDLPPLCRRAQDSHADLEALVSALAVVGVNGLVVIEPARDVFDVRRHVEVIVHTALARFDAVLGDRAPAAAREDFGKAFGTLGANAVLAPPGVD